jgi:hypothetical protein
MKQQIAPMSPELAADPDFLAGLAEGGRSFQDLYAWDGMPSLRIVLNEIVADLSEEPAYGEQRAALALGTPVASPAYRAGFLLSWLTAHVATKETAQCKNSM